MPLYDYSCTACGHIAEVRQGINDAKLTTCPKCNAETFTRLIGATNFALKGEGYYVTDFKGATKTPKESNDA
jgi:putative FmdB family regulatory protein